MKNCIKTIQRLKYAIFLLKREAGSKGLSNGNNVKRVAIWLNWLGEITIDVLTHERIKLRLKFLTGLFDILE